MYNKIMPQRPTQYIELMRSLLSLFKHIDWKKYSMKRITNLSGVHAIKHKSYLRDTFAQRFIKIYEQIVFFLSVTCLVVDFPKTFCIV